MEIYANINAEDIRHVRHSKMSLLDKTKYTERLTALNIL